MKKYDDAIARLRELITIPTIMWEEEAGHVIHANESAAAAFEIPVSALTGVQVLDLLVDPLERALVIQQALRGGAASEVELRMRRGGQGWFWARLNLTAMEHQGQRFVCANFMDVTSRKAREAELLEALHGERDQAVEEAERLIQQRAHAKRRLSLLLKVISVMAYQRRGDETLELLSVSEGCLKLTGYDAEEIKAQGRGYRALIHEDDREVVEQTYRRALAEGGSFKVEYRIKARDGALRWVWEQGEVYGADHADGRILEGVIQDITEHVEVRTERARLELRVATAQRLESLGRFTGSIAHDFNNLLAVIQSYAGFVKDDLAGAGPQEEDLDVIQDAARRATGLTRQLLAFSRGQPDGQSVVDLNAVLGEMVSMLRRMLGGDVVLALELEEGLCRVKMNMTQLEQVLMNLLINARDAMPDGGTITIKTANVEVDEVDSGRALPLGGYVSLSVSDTGAGMDEETQLRAFEPFFTTKDKDKGTGLGLSTVIGIVKQSGGDIQLRSAPGEGAIFEIYLPQIEADALMDGLPHVPTDLSGSEAVLLLIGDDLPMTRAVVRALEREGYSVLQVNEAAAARAALTGGLGGVELLIVDMGASSLVDAEAVQEAMRGRAAPALVLLTDAGGVSVEVGRGLEGVQALSRPFMVRQLLERARLALDSRGRR